MELINYRMRYKQYKESYADCDTVPNSYNKDTKTIEVLVPKERLKPSGTRGQSYHYFNGVKVKDKNGNIVNIGGIKAISWTNACKQIRKMGYEPIE